MPGTGKAGLPVEIRGFPGRLAGSHLDPATREMKLLPVHHPTLTRIQLAGKRCCCRSTLTTTFCVAAALATLAPAVVGGYV